MPTLSKNFRKAAILVASLEDSLAKKLLDRLDPIQANKVRLAAERINDIRAEEREEAMREFTLNPAPTAKIKGTGVEIDSSLSALIERAFDDDGETNLPWNEGALSIGDKYSAQPSHERGQEEGSFACHPFEFIESADIGTVATLLKQEHPQTIAMIVSCLPSERAASIVMQLSTSTQVDVLRRMSSIEASDPESIEVLAKELRTCVEDIQQQREQRQRGIATVQEILAAIDTKDRSSLLVRIQQRDGALASKLGFSVQSPNQASKLSRNAGLDLPSNMQIAKRESEPALKAVVEKESQAKLIESKLSSNTSREALGENVYSLGADEFANHNDTIYLTPVPFDKLIHLDDGTWRKLLLQAEPELLSLALTMADSDLIDRVASFLPSSACVAFKQSLQTVGPTRLADIESARQELSKLAGHHVQFQPAAHEVFQELA